MVRAFFLAIGATLCILGIECLIIQKAVLAPPAAMASTGPVASLAYSTSASQREIVPPDWAPWSLLSAGAVLFLYCFTIPRRVNGG